MIIAIRGATTLNQDNLQEASQALKDLWEDLLASNSVASTQIIDVFFTVTPDIHKVSPPKITRQLMSWRDIPMMCSVEPDIEGFPELCIRLLLHVESDMKRADVTHVYQRGAVALRPDLQ